MCLVSELRTFLSPGQWWFESGPCKIYIIFGDHLLLLFQNWLRNVVSLLGLSIILTQSYRTKVNLHFQSSRFDKKMSPINSYTNTINRIFQIIIKINILGNQYTNCINTLIVTSNGYYSLFFWIPQAIIFMYLYKFANFSQWWKINNLQQSRHLKKVPTNFPSKLSL